MRTVKGQITLENGMKASFSLTSEEMAILQDEAARVKRSVYELEGKQIDYSMMDELVAGAIRNHLRVLESNQKKVETPAVGAAGESKSNK